MKTMGCKQLQFNDYFTLQGVSSIERKNYGTRKVHSEGLTLVLSAKKAFLYVSPEFHWTGCGKLLHIHS